LRSKSSTTLNQGAPISARQAPHEVNLQLSLLLLLGSSAGTDVAHAVLLVLGSLGQLILCSAHDETPI
jgi:hypothetical protein